MKEYNYEIKFKAASKEEAVAKMKAACILIDALNEKEISKLAHIVKHDPIKTAIAKKALGV